MFEINRGKDNLPLFEFMQKIFLKRLLSSFITLTFKVLKFFTIFPNREETHKFVSWQFQGGKMFIQGSLQNVFDALYKMGKIDPALNADWKEAQKKIKSQPDKFKQVVHAVNSSNADLESLINKLKEFDDESLVFLAMEVAREYVDFECSPTRH